MSWQGNEYGYICRYSDMYNWPPPERPKWHRLRRVRHGARTLYGFVVIAGILTATAVVVVAVTITHPAVWATTAVMLAAIACMWATIIRGLVRQRGARRKRERA